MKRITNFINQKQYLYDLVVKILGGIIVYLFLTFLNL